MPDNKNIWSKKFNSTSLQNEDWLEPSDSIFDNIDKEIYGKKKSKKGIVFLLLGFFSCLLLISGLFISQSQEVAVDISTEVQPSNIDNESRSQGLTQTQEVIQSDKLEISPIAIKEESTNQSTVAENSLNTKQVKSIAIGIAPNNPTNTTISYSSLTKKSASIINEGITKVRLSTSKLNDLGKTSSNKQAVLFKPENIVSLSPYSLNIYDRSNKKFKAPDTTEPINSIHTNKRTASIKFGALHSCWAFNLNENYSSALQSADFTHEDARGYGLFFEYDKPFNHRLSFSIGMNYEKVELVSGHNSQVDFDNNLASNNYNLTMASPLGFLSSSVVVSVIDLPSNNSTSLILDLKNIHTIQSLSLYTKLNYNLVNSKLINLSASIGMGVNRLVTVQNELDSFTPDNSNFVSENGQVTMGQANLNNNRVFGIMGINIEKPIYRHSTIGLNLNYISDLSPIHQFQDFSSSVNRQNVALYYKFNF